MRVCVYLGLTNTNFYFGCD